MTEILRELIEIIKETSPHAWEILVRQAVAEGLVYLIWAVALTISTGWLHHVTRKFHLKIASADERYYVHDDRFVGVILSYVLQGAGAIVAISLLSSAILRFINPEFYAIRYLFAVIGE